MSIFLGMGINLYNLCTIIILQFPGMYLFAIYNLKVFIRDYVKNVIVKKSFIEGTIPAVFSLVKIIGK